MKVTRVSKHTILSLSLSLSLCPPPTTLSPSLPHTHTLSLSLPPPSTPPPLLSLPASGEDAREILRMLGATVYTMFETHYDVGMDERTRTAVIELNLDTEH
jgi:hypothetical protein